MYINILIIFLNKNYEILIKYYLKFERIILLPKIIFKTLFSFDTKLVLIYIFFLNIVFYLQYNTTI